MLLQVQCSEKGICVVALAVDLDSRADGLVLQYEIRERGYVKKLRVDIKELAEQLLDSVEVNLGVKVEPLKIDVDDVEVLSIAVSEARM